TPRVSASGAGADAATPNPFTGSTSINAGGGASATYYMFLQGPAGPVNSVPYGFDAVIGTSVVGNATATATITVAPFGNSDSDNTNVNITRTNGGSFSAEIPLMLTPLDTYQVMLSAAAAGFASGSSASAFADPHIFFDLSIDPSFT